MNSWPLPNVFLLFIYIVFLTWCCCISKHHPNTLQNSRIQALLLSEEQRGTKEISAEEGKGSGRRKGMKEQNFLGPELLAH